MAVMLCKWLRIISFLPLLHFLDEGFLLRLCLGQSNKCGERMIRRGRSLGSTGEGRERAGKAAKGVLLQSSRWDWGIRSGEEEREESICSQPTWSPSRCGLLFSRRGLLELGVEIQGPNGGGERLGGEGVWDKDQGCSVAELGTRLGNWIWRTGRVVRVFSWLNPFPGLLSGYVLTKCLLVAWDHRMSLGRESCGRRTLYSVKMESGKGDHSVFPATELG